MVHRCRESLAQCCREMVVHLRVRIDNNRVPINKGIVEKRAGVPFDQLVDICIEQLERMNNRRILDGVGEFLTSSQKDWAKAKLRQETIALLTLRKED